MRIIYYAHDYNMGDTPPADCDRFRDWAQRELEHRYPDAEIEVLNEQCLDQCVIFEGYDEIDFTAAADIEDFCSRLWDYMKW
ncbi:MAG TPA: hypothetical protein PLK94_05035 [Alphaproteobacteria bacterium]|nr:hypothetical protein [Alphaproteobacteria bacterium]